MKTQKTVQANYTPELVSLICAEYSALIEQGYDNKAILTTLCEKHGKTVPSIRAKLASLKVYVSGDTKADNAPVSGGKVAKKEDIASAIAAIVGTELNGLEAATKQALQAILTYLLKVAKLLEEKDKKIDCLVAEMLADEPLIIEDINDND